MSNATLTYEQHTGSATPWLPDQTFVEQNASAIGEVMGLVAEDYPHVAEVVDFDAATLPPDDQRKALWKLLMGRQHGLQDGSDGKVTVERGRVENYRRALGKIAIGPHSLMEEAPVDPSVEYDAALMTGGAPFENIARIRTAFGPVWAPTKVKEIVALTGQRKRGMWQNIPGEDSVEDLLATIGVETSTDMQALIERSPFVQGELAREGEDWEAPFASEYEMYRLAVEAELGHLIDWDHYDETVIVQPPVGVNEEMRYDDNGREIVIPPRQEGAVTYNLTDGRRVHIVNGAATVRSGAPRATSTSIAQEAMNYVPIKENAKLVAISAAPHFRAGMDTIITYLDEARKRGITIDRADVATSKWETRITNIVAALGEIMATMKADYRLRAVLRGEDPNSAELMAI